MTTKTKYLTSLVAAGVAAVTIAAAPTAAAAGLTRAQTSCSSAMPGSECITPGNAQLNDSLPPDFAPQYPDFSLFGLGRVGRHR